jgi:surfeit locus 1 family protein
MILPILFGLGGIAILLWLGMWQMQRLNWKEALIEQVQSGLAADPVPLFGFYKSTAPISERNRKRVSFNGRVTNNEAFVYAPSADGLGYRVVSEFFWNDKSFLLDLGWIKETQKNDERPVGDMRVIGHILFPDDHDAAFTPEPDLEKNIFFSRFTSPIAQALGATPFLVVVETAEIKVDDIWQPYDSVRPQPVNINFKNDHKEYAITWFSLAFVWFGMTLYLLWRIRQRTV